MEGAYDSRCYRLLSQIQGTTEIEGEAGPISLRPGWTALVEPGRAVHWQSEGNVIRIVCDLVARPRFVKGGKAQAGNDTPQPLLQDLCHRRVDPLVPEHLRQDAVNCAERLAMVRPADPSSVCTTNAGLHVFLARWFEDWRPPPPGANQPETLVNRVENLILSQVSGGIRITDIADQLGYHPNYIISAYSRLRGYGPRHFLALERLRRAQRLLVESRNSVAAIARECGYGHASSMRAAFVRLAGCSPREWRQRYRSGAHAPPVTGRDDPSDT